MFLKSLKLSNFKNYNNLNIQFNEKLNLIYGNNAQGKTNLIESIFYLSSLDLFRNIKNEEIVNYNEDKALIEGIINIDEIEKIYTVKIENNVRQQFINNKKITNIKEYFGNFYVVAYNPSNISLIDSFPGIRRKYFDRNIFYKNILFIDLVKQFNKTLIERNTLLKNDQIDEKLLKIYTALLIDLSSKYIFTRIQFLKSFNKFLKESYEKIVSENEKPKIIYRFAGKEGNEELSINEIKEKLEIIFKENKENELKERKTLFGPHLDDFLFLLNGKKIKSFGSQGQKKTFLLALKFSELENLKNFTPIFLIDDLTSELDFDRNESLMRYVKNYQNQTFITTTNLSVFSEKFIEDFSKFQVENGKLI